MNPKEETTKEDFRQQGRKYAGGSQSIVHPRLERGNKGGEGEASQSMKQVCTRSRPRVGGKKNHLTKSESNWKNKPLA